MLLFAIDFLRNFIGEVMPWKVGLVLLFLNQWIQFTVYILICRFFIKAASNLVGKERVKRWKAFSFYFMSAVYIFLAVYAVMLIEPDWFFPERKTKAPCKTNEFWIQDALLLSVLLGFLYAAKVISDAI
jgi:hypothetical protein